MTMSTTLPPWPPAPFSEAKSPPDDPELVAWARETVFGVIAKYDKASETTTRDRVKHPTDVAKLTTARGRVYRALGKLRRETKTKNNRTTTPKMTTTLVLIIPIKLMMTRLRLIMVQKNSSKAATNTMDVVSRPVIL